MSVQSQKRGQILLDAESGSLDRQSNELDDQAHGLAIRVVAAHYPVILLP